MNQQTMPNVTLFDLLARNWQRQAPVRHLCFNEDDTLLAIGSVDGAVALARLGDNEPPESRIVIDNGQTTIQPRLGKPSPLISTRIHEGARLSAHRDGAFLAATRSGDLLRVDRTGAIVAKVLSDKGPICAFDHCRATGLSAAAVSHRLRLQSGETDTIREIDLGDRKPAIVSIAGDGRLVALACSGSLSVWRIADDPGPLIEMSLPSSPLSLEWSADGRWLGCGLQTGGLVLLNADTGHHIMLGDFPGPVAMLDWSPVANTVLASGAYRIAGWSMDAPPPGARATGRGGFVMVDAVAAHPVKALVAAGYPNGRIAIAPIGSPEELIVRDAGGPVTALQWSTDGRHLAVGDALGNAAIVTFPNEIFK
ncbi:WD40 repeat domain-containing protein [Pararhizobium sp. LjRoot238]|uniref:WD40 repeat domain-containing protein n=1 Tax=Pararhizobium sp. LjRoot238 TaxID=3342293 RepID=UPI003ECF95E9